MAWERSNAALTVDLIQSEAVKVRLAAEELRGRIVRFEEFLNNVKGRVATQLIGKNVTLTFERRGKRWELLFNNTETNLERLADAPLAVKMEAVRMFPDLLLSIEKSQEQLIAELKTAVIDFDELWGPFIPKPESGR